MCVILPTFRQLPFVNESLHYMVLCTGCNREFSASGFTRHVNTMTTAVCRATYHNAFVLDCVADNDVDMENVMSHHHVTSFFYLIKSRTDSSYISVPRDASWMTHGS